MAAAVGNLVWETSTTTGTGNLTTARNGGYQRGSGAFGTTDNGAANPYIFIVNRDAAADEWEIRQTYWSAAGTLVRSGAPSLSSNSNNAVDFGAGTKDVTNDIPAALQALMPSSSTDNAVARFDGTGGRTLQNSALLVADTTGALSRSGNGGIQVQGTNTNDNAAAGEKGELASNSAMSVSLSTGTVADITSVSLTAGDWDVDGRVYFLPAGTTVLTAAGCAVNTTSATLPSVPGGAYHLAQGSLGTGLAQYMPTGTVRISISSTTTVYLVAVANFTTSTCTAHGFIRARRVR